VTEESVAWVKLSQFWLISPTCDGLTHGEEFGVEGI